MSEIITVKKIGLVRDMEFEQSKIVEADGKEILLVRLGRTITAIGNKCTRTRDAGYPMAGSMAKRSAALVMGRCLTSGLVKLWEIRQ